MDIIFDLDGTLANLDHRLHLVKTKPKNWKAFFAGVSEDTVIDVIFKLYKKVMLGNRIIICSGRSDSCKQATEEWLYDNGIHYSALYMRKSDDCRDDATVKKELLYKMRDDGYNPLLAFDDRQRVVDMWREEGLTCCQVAKGDF